MTGEIVRFVREEEVREAAGALWRRVEARLTKLLPGADVQHVGATAVPGALTKGDVDVNVRVAADHFAATEAVLAANFARNTGSDRTDFFAAFQDDGASPPLGIQLTAIGGECDFFIAQREIMRTDRAVARAYDELKRSFEGRLMDDYRAAKERFFADLRRKTQ